jgi:tetratricopeptide (TPR) repeat protein
MLSRPQINAKKIAGIPGCSLLWILPVIAGLSCAPSLSHYNDISVNPVEVLEKSPRIYHIGFEAIADSMGADLLSTYLRGSLNLALEPPPIDQVPDADKPARTRAETEYWKARRRFEGGATEAAAMHLQKALEIDPGFKPPYLMLAELLFIQRRHKEAANLYLKVLTWDVTSSEALTGLAKCYMAVGRLDNARKALVDAVIFNRVNLEAWENLYVLGEVQDFTVTNHDAPELGIIRKIRHRHYDLVVEEALEECPIQATAWIVFASQRAVWRYEGKYKRYTGTTKYMPTYEEDVDCYMALAAAWKVLSRQDTTVCDSHYLDHLDQVADEGYLVPHVLFDYVCLKDPGAARDFSLEVIEEMRAYISRYVLVSEG